MRQNNMIIIHKEENGYMSEFLGPHSEEIYDLFGTRVIPTAYSAVANRNVVAAAIKQLNPGMEINLCPCCH